VCSVGENLVLANAEAQSRRTGDALLLSEFSDTGRTDIVGRVVSEADAAMVPWTHWGYIGSGGGGNLIRDPSRPPTGENLNTDLLAVLARPYPLVVAGTPLAWSFDPGPGVFEARWSVVLPDGRQAGRGASEVMIPRRAYPNGYEVTVDGADVTSSSGANVLRVRARPGASEVKVRVTRR
jgi:endoglycosylceramidase